MTTPTTTPTTTPVHPVSCHCGHVQLAVRADVKQATRCNCTICTKLGWLGVLLEPGQVTVTTDESTLGTYAWGHKVSTRYFCPRCGTPVYGRGHLAVLGGDFVSVNVNCFDDLDPATLEVGYWDGRHDNWQAGLRATPWPITP